METAYDKAYSTDAPIDNYDKEIPDIEDEESGVKYYGETKPNHGVLTKDGKPTLMRQGQGK